MRRKNLKYLLVISIIDVGLENLGVVKDPLCRTGKLVSVCLRTENVIYRQNDCSRVEGPRRLVVGNLAQFRDKR